MVALISYKPEVLSKSAVQLVKDMLIPVRIFPLVFLAQFYPMFEFLTFTKIVSNLCLICSYPSSIWFLPNV